MLAILLRLFQSESDLVLEELAAIVRHGTSVVAVLLLEFVLKAVSKRTLSTEHFPIVDELFLWFMVAALTIFSVSCVMLLGIIGLSTCRASWFRYRKGREEASGAIAGRLA